MLSVIIREAFECIRARGLITGEAVGQVSSQTLPNLGVVQSVATLPVLRPLVASGKEEIFEDARRLGTFDASAKVPEYCGMAPADGSVVAADVPHS